MRGGQRGERHAERMRAFAELLGQHGYVTCKALMAATGEKHTTVYSWLVSGERRGELAHVAHRAGWRMQGRYTFPTAPNAFRGIEKGAAGCSTPATTRSSP